MRALFMFCLSLVLVSCDGNSSVNISFDTGEGSWQGRTYQADGISCADGNFLAVGAGVTIGDAQIDVYDEQEDVYLDPEGYLHGMRIV